MRRMIGLDAYTVVQLQVCKSLLVALLGDGVDTIDTAIDLIEGDVASRVAEVEEIQPSQPSKISTSGGLIEATLSIMRMCSPSASTQRRRPTHSRLQSLSLQPD